MPAMLDRASILISERVGRTQSLTPEGFLLCADVRIARTGEMLYAAREIPDIAPLNGLVTLVRDADVLFAESTIVSFAGKPVTNDHPPDFVSPQNFKDHTVGIVLEPRRGEGEDADFLIADLLIMDAKAIADVQAGKREVSCGYDCMREQIRPGFGRQTGVLGNHVALVAKGRAGPTCSINDGDNMTKPTNIFSRIRAAFTAQDRDALEDTLDHVRKVVADEDGEEKKDEKDEEKKDDKVSDALAKLTDTLAKFGDRMSAIESKIADMDKEDDEEEKKTEDSKVVRDAFNEIVSRAEIVAPGIKLPAYDEKKSGTLVLELSRSALRAALSDAKKGPIVTAVLGATPAFDSMPLETATMALRGVAEAVKAMNAPPPPPPLNDMRIGRMTPADLQKINEAARRT